MKTIEFAIEKETSPGIWSRVPIAVPVGRVKAVLAHVRNTSKVPVRAVRHTITTKVLPF